MEEFVVHGLFVLLWKRNGEFFTYETKTMPDPLISTGMRFSYRYREQKIENEIVNQKNPLNMLASG